MRVFHLATMAVFAVAACGDGPTGPDATLYSLESVNEQSLPTGMPGVDAVEIVEGSLALSSGGTVVQRLRVRCRADQPFGSECTETNGGWSERSGIYDDSEGWIEFDGFRFGAIFGDDDIRVTFSSMSMGLPTVVHVYVR